MIFVGYLATSQFSEEQIKMEYSYVLSQQLIIVFRMEACSVSNSFDLPELVSSKNYVTLVLTNF